MRIFGVTVSLLAAMLALSGCGGESAPGTSGATANHPPVINGTPVTRLNVGTRYSFQPTAVDPDGDTVSFSAINLPAWASIDSNSGRVSGTPTESNVGVSGMITIQASDGRLASELPEFSIEVMSVLPPPPTNTAPTIQGTPGTQATVGQTYTFTPVGQDADGDTLTYTITNQPTWATFTPTTGVLTGTPAAGNVGTTAGIVITVSDGNETDSLAAFSLTVSAAAPTNRPPTIGGTPPTSVTVGTAYVFRPVGSDPDGNALTYTQTGKPAWLNFSGTTGRLSGTPTAANVGTSRITITVSDGSLTATLPAFDLQVMPAPNQAPVITGSPPTTATVGQQYSFTPNASDPDGDTLTFAITNKPDWLGFNTVSGALTGTPGAGDVGTFSGIIIIADDGEAIDSLSPFAILVAQVANGSATISWIPPTENTDNSPLTNLSGYRLTYGRSASQLDQTVTINNAGLTTYTVNGLATGTWYFALYARVSTGSESDASNVAQHTID